MWYIQESVQQEMTPRRRKGPSNNCDTHFLAASLFADTRVCSRPALHRSKLAEPAEGWHENGLGKLMAPPCLFCNANSERAQLQIGLQLPSVQLSQHPSGCNPTSLLSSAREPCEGSLKVKKINPNMNRATAHVKYNQIIPRKSSTFNRNLFCTERFWRHEFPV